MEDFSKISEAMIMKGKHILKSSLILIIIKYFIEQVLSVRHHHYQKQQQIEDHQNYSQKQ